MPYLIHYGTYDCVDKNIGVFELLHNLSTVKNKSFENYNLEEDIDDISFFHKTNNLLLKKEFVKYISH